MGITSSKFLPNVWRKYPLYKEIIVPLIDHVINLHEERFKYITGKYTNYISYDEQIARELITELGFEYVLNGITLNSEDVRVIFGYLKLFHLLKGSKDGLKVILDLLGYDYDELEWFMQDEFTSFTRAQLMSNADLPISINPYTFKVVLNLLLSGFDIEKIRKFREFARFYVYSVMSLFLGISFELAEIDISFAGFVDQKYSTSSGIIGVVYKSFGGFVDQTFTSGELPPSDVLFTHLFARDLEDSGDNNNDYIEQITNESTNYLFEHVFKNNLSDSNLTGNDYTEDSTSLLNQNTLFKHQFSNLEDSVNNNDYTEDITSQLNLNTIFEHKFIFNIDDSINNNDFTQDLTSYEEDYQIKIYFNEGLIEDKSIYKLSLALFNSASIENTSVVPGKTSNLRLDGTDDYAKVEYSPVLNNRSIFTDFMVFRFNSISDSQPVHLFGRNDTSTDFNGNIISIFYYGAFGAPYTNSIMVQIMNSYTSQYGQYVFPLSSELTTATTNSVHIGYKQKVNGDTESTLKVWINGIELSYAANTGNIGLDLIKIKEYSYHSSYFFGAFLSGLTPNAGIDYFPDIRIDRFSSRNRLITGIEAVNEFNALGI